MTATSDPMPTDHRPLRVAELLAVGTELTVGETTDTNSGELARSLVALGVVVARVSILPDDLTVVTEALLAALDRADLVLATGGLGPTPDDLTREAVAAACGETTSVRADTLAWLEGLWARRGQPFPATNVKQAWTIPSATILPNPNGTAPGWWVDRPDGRVIVTLPGPPREMRPMWHDAVLPKLAARGIGAETEVRTLRLTGIGESQVADLLGEALLRATNPIVATYARAEAVDVRVSARAAGGRSAASLADEAEQAILAHLGAHVWARGATTWREAVAELLSVRGWTIATVERGTEGALVGLLDELGARRRSEVLPGEGAPAPAEGVAPAVPGSDGVHRDDEAEAHRVRVEAGADVGLALRIEPAGDDTYAHITVVTPRATVHERRLAFLRGSHGRDRAAIAAAAVLLATLRSGD